MRGMRVPSLVRELRSHMLQSDQAQRTETTEPVCAGAHTPQLESQCGKKRSCRTQQRPDAAKQINTC